MVNTPDRPHPWRERLKRLSRFFMSPSGGPLLPPEANMSPGSPATYGGQERRAPFEPGDFEPFWPQVRRRVHVTIERIRNRRTPHG